MKEPKPNLEKQIDKLSTTVSSLTTLIINATKEEVDKRSKKKTPVT